MESWLLSKGKTFIYKKNWQVDQLVNLPVFFVFSKSVDYLFIWLICRLLVVLDKVLASHIGWLLHSENVEDRRSYVSQTTVLDSC